jgi:PhnB protein
MSVVLNPYLSFKDTARQAMEFYRSVFGGELTVSTFGENSGMGVDAAEQDRVMHAMLVAGSDLTLMGADTPTSMGEPSPNGSVSLSGDDVDTLRGYWDKLSGSGTATMPLDQAPWGDWFGMCVDGFGVSWMVNIAGASTTG